jgi:carbon-monoxide dehydrogenase large subunit
VRVDASFTHTVSTDPYRGAGRPEVLYFIERLMDKAAHEIGVDPAAFRKQNLIPLAQFPYASPTGLNYDPCDFASIMDRALELSDWKDRNRRKASAASRGVLHGVGMANYIERCGGGAGLSERADLAIEPDGQVTLRIGSMTNGQGHRTAYAQLINHLLDIPIENVRLVQGDTDRVVSGTGTGGSWSIPMGGGALKLAADRIVETATMHAADRLEADANDLEFADGVFSVVGTDLRVTLTEVVGHAATRGAETAAGRPGLEETGIFQPENYTFPYGCHICELEVDPETGNVTVLRYLAVHDFGTALNPLLLAGQVHGGLAQGIGQALHESVRFDETGQLLSATFMDYAIPRADDLPSFEFEHWQSPALSNPFDIKGCGEAGAAGSPPAVINALIDALLPLGIERIDMPATPHRVWRAITDAQQRR